MNTYYLKNISTLYLKIGGDVKSGYNFFTNLNMSCYKGKKVVKMLRCYGYKYCDNDVYLY